ncbi:tetratricopeptide repeat protein [Austwickia sp. TVS 96-490-7B]|uniref:tetratricopeptide repeat protein n=1 Tax=Austwickia sp. TVS 96-490-7B TaxID=2830843 RepID=UPI001C5705CB|nr:tetratricopeptide repeat protein [Austwickia sp. TVS 96-490-7B]
MSLPGSPSGALRGAVDLSSLGRTPRPPVTPGAPAGASGARGAVTEVTDASFEEAFLATRDVAALFVIYDGESPQTRGAVDAAVEAAAGCDGRLRVCAVDVRLAPRLAQGLGVQQVPVTMAVIAGQPVPLFAGVQPAAQLRPVCEQVLQLAAQNGVTGRVEPTAQVDPIGDDQPQIPPLHARAVEAIDAGDLAGAVAAYEQALKENPADADAKVGVAQVRLLQRVDGADLVAARQAAAADPDSIEAALLVADLDLVGGHVEDAFARLIDLVRRTSEDDRDAVRARLLELFELVGASDDRVTKARRALMSALF